MALIGLRLRVPAAPVEPPAHPLDTLGAGLLAAATSTLLLACVQDAGRVPLAGATLALGARARRPASAARADPIVPLRLLRTRTVALVSGALFLATAALFAVTVFVPLFLQTATGATPTEAGLLLAPAMLGITVSTTLSGRAIARTGRYKRFPVAGLALMTAALARPRAGGRRVLAGDHRRRAGRLRARFGMVTQVLVTAIQNTVERRDLGVATATAGFFRALGGAVGAAVLGAVFAARAGSGTTDVVDGAQAVFAVAAPLAALALLVVLALREVPLERPGAAPAPAPRAPVAATAGAARR